MTSREGHVKIPARFKAVGHQSSVGIKLESRYQAGIVEPANARQSSSGLPLRAVGLLRAAH